MPIKIDVFDAKGKALKVIPDIWSGTTAIVAGELRPFSMPIGVGISLRLNAAQIIELASGGGSKSAAGYGFGAHEGGFSADDAEEEAPAEGGEEVGEEGQNASDITDF